MDVKEKLISALTEVLPYSLRKAEELANEIADPLIAAGVTIPVRCKDCKHFKPIPGYTHVDGFCCYSGRPVGKKETGYCNLGERRNDHG